MVNSGLVLVVFLGVVLVSIFVSYQFFQLYRKHGVSQAWMSFIPIFNVIPFLKIIKIKSIWALIPIFYFFLFIITAYEIQFHPHNTPNYIFLMVGIEVILLIFNTILKIYWMSSVFKLYQLMNALSVIPILYYVIGALNDLFSIFFSLIHVNYSNTIYGFLFSFVIGVMLIILGFIVIGIRKLNKAF